MSWNRDWTVQAQNIFEALNVQAGDRLAILYSPFPKGKEFLAKALAKLAGAKNIPSISVDLNLDENFDISPLEKELYKFFDGTKSSQRKCLFTASGSCYGPSRRKVHALMSTDSNKLAGYTISLPTDGADIVANLAGTSPKKLLKRGEDLNKILSKTTKIHITTEKGTDLKFDWTSERRKYLISAGLPHFNEDRWDNMGGEIYTAPLHETVNGRLVIDGAISGIGLVDGTVVVNVLNGRGTIDEKESTASKNIIDKFHHELTLFPCACVVGEFGIGTTPNLKLIGELLNDEKVEGTIHIAFGDSYSGNGSGGENDCDAHTDCMVTSPTVDMTIDGKVVRLMDKGKFDF